MKTLSLLLVVFCSLTQAQNSVSLVQYLDSPGTNSITVQAPATLSGNVTLTLPVPTGTTGCVQDSTGAGVLTISACGVPTVPVTISGSSTSPILTLTQTGAGPTLVTGGGNVGIGMSSPAFLLDVNGAENLHGNLSVSADNTFNIFAASLAPSTIYTHALSASGNAVFTGLVAEGLSGCPPCSWDISGGGVGGFTSGGAYFQDVTSRYVFNSAGDVAQTGTVNVSGTAATATSGTFDQSFVGGQLLICPGGCTGTNGSLYLISALISSTQVTLATSPGTLTGAGYSYQANAFQTSLGTMYVTGGGFGYFQNLVVTDGFTSYGAGSITGTITCSGTSCVWASGAKFNLSMQGGFAIIGGSQYTISSVPTTTELVLATSCSGSCSGTTFAYTANAFQISNHAAYIESNGDAVFAQVGTPGGFSSSGVNIFQYSTPNINPPLQVYNAGFTAIVTLGGIDVGSSDPSSFGGNVTVSGSLIANGAATFNGNASVPVLSTLTIGGDETLSGTSVIHFDGVVAGTHGQPFGTGDSITVASCTGCGGGVAAGTGITVSGSTVTLNQTPASGTAFLNYGGGGLQVWTSDLAGSGGTFLTYSNKIAVYNNAGTFVGYVPII